MSYARAGVVLKGRTSPWVEVLCVEICGGRTEHGMRNELSRLSTILFF